MNDDFWHIKRCILTLDMLHQVAVCVNSIWLFKTIQWNIQYLKNLAKSLLYAYGQCYLASCILLNKTSSFLLDEIHVTCQSHTAVQMTLI